MKRILIFLGHPAHFHLFRYLIPKLQREGHTVKVLIRSKDILEELCKHEGLEFVNVQPTYRKKGVISFALSFLQKYVRIGSLIRSFKPDMLLGSEPTLAHLGKVFRISSFIFSEDDVHVIPQFAKVAYPFVSAIVSPETCDAGKWSHKKIGYAGFHKLAYLHPSVFTPDKSLLGEMTNRPYFILRLAELSAYHDVNRKGITAEVARQLIDLLQPHGDIYITSERALEPEFEMYRMKLPVQHIHHAMYFAQAYIGDSQSMAVEAALLGTPGIRFNDFNGEIGVLNELENRYSLTYSISTKEPQRLLDKVKEFLSQPDLKEQYGERRFRLLDEKINVPDFFIWLITHYPSSAHELKNNPNIQHTFR